tara:strand:+ start:596 stop:742 length:147 start_codon:yes stop_codon:yes gene_type:complete
MDERDEFNFIGRESILENLSFHFLDLNIEREYQDASLLSMIPWINGCR